MGLSKVSKYLNEAMLSVREDTRTSSRLGLASFSTRPASSLMEGNILGRTA